MPRPNKINPNPPPNHRTPLWKKNVSIPELFLWTSSCRGPYKHMTWSGVQPQYGGSGGDKAMVIYSGQGPPGRQPRTVQWFRCPPGTRRESRPTQTNPGPPGRSRTAVSLVTPIIAVVVAVTLQFLRDADPIRAQEALTPSAERWKRKRGGEIRMDVFILLNLGERNKKIERKKKKLS